MNEGSPRIVVLDGGCLNPGDLCWKELAELGALTVFDRTQPDQVLKRAIDASIVLTNKVRLDAAELDLLPQLKFISITATGFGVVDRVRADRLGILVSNVPDYSTNSVAQHVFAMLLSFLHRPADHHAAIISGQWQQADAFSFWLSPLSELSGKTMGIVGLGRIGKRTATLANAFGMRVLGTGGRQRQAPDIDGFRWTDLEELFSESDVISLHCPLDDSNRGFVNQRLLERMKPSSILVNTARGGLINELELAQALDDGQLAGALLDVVSSEPIVGDNPLLKARNCLLTPHLAWATVESRHRLMQQTVANVAAYLAGSPINLVSAQR